MLYAQRFFPYYVYNILGGIEEDGNSILSPLLSFSGTVRKSILLMIPFTSQAAVPCTHLTLWDHMSERLVEPQVPHNH